GDCESTDRSVTAIGASEPCVIDTGTASPSGAASFIRSFSQSMPRTETALCDRIARLGYLCGADAGVEATVALKTLLDSADGALRRRTRARVRHHADLHPARKGVATGR